MASRAEPELISFAEARKERIKVRGATIRNLKTGARRLVLTIVPLQRRKQAEIELEVRCDTKMIPLKLTIDLSRPPQVNRSVPVKPLDR